MSLETTALKTTQEAVDKGTRMVDAAIKKAWSILDAAAEKKPPSEYLSPKAIQLIQGIPQSAAK